MNKKMKYFTLILVFIMSIFQPAEAAKTPLEQGKTYMYNAAIAINQNERNFYIKKASSEFQKAYDKDMLNIEASIGLGKTLAYMGNQQKAKQVLMQAYSTYPTDARIQAAVGDFNYIFQEYNTALEFYKLSLSSGNLRDYRTNFSTAQCYEKLGDLKNARTYYEITQMLHPNDIDAEKRLKSLDSIYEYHPIDKQKAVFEAQDTSEDIDINTLIDNCKNFKN
ncbi:MAG: hypothetical protein PHV37_06385 [Candidatus Gastranaerophilales bacterium]|nr:hypothetical protein [Candidatus Gastranaerophilales bacterium]